MSETSADLPMKTSATTTMPTYQIASGGRQQLSPFQLEKAKYFFHVNLDLENKGYVIWEDVDFYILFHMTAVGRESDSELEKLLNQRTKTAWDIIHSNWPDTDENRITVEQFLDTWASLSQYIKSEDKLPEWLEQWINAGFNLYDIKGDGRIRPVALHSLYSKMGLRVISATAAYHAMLEAVGGPLTLEAVLTLSKKLITSDNPSDLSGFLMPGFTVNLIPSKPPEPPAAPETSSPDRSSARHNGNPVVVESGSKIEEPSPQIQRQHEKQTMHPPKSSVPDITSFSSSSRFGSFQSNSGLINTNFPKTNPSQQQPAAMKQNFYGSQPILIPSTKQPEQPAAYGGSVTSQNGKRPPSHLGKMPNDMHNWNRTRFPLQNRNVPHQPNVVQQPQPNISNKSDRGFICKILQEMNINPSECEILIDENGNDIRSGGGAFPPRWDNEFNHPGAYQGGRWQPVVDPRNRQLPPGMKVRPPPLSLHAHRPPLPPNIHNPCLFEHSFKPSLQHHGSHRLPGPPHPPLHPHYRSNMGPFPRAYSSIPNSLENLSRIEADDPRRNGFQKMHRFANVRHMATTTGPQQPGRLMGRSLVDDTLVTEVVKKATPLIRQIVREEVMKYIGSGANSKFPQPMSTGTSRPTMGGEHIRPPPTPKRHQQNKEKENLPRFMMNGRPPFPNMPDEYEFNGSMRKTKPDKGGSMSDHGGGASKPLKGDGKNYKQSRGSPRQVTEELSDSGDPTTVMEKSEAATDDDFWRGESGQSPTVNKMIFDRLWKRQHEMKSANKSPISEKKNDDDDDDGDGGGDDGVTGNDDEADHSESEAKAFQKLAGGDGAEASDNTLEDEMLFIPGIGAYPPFISMGMDERFLQSGGFVPPPFMMAMGPSMFAAQAADFSSDMEGTPPGMDGVFIVIDDKPMNGKDDDSQRPSDNTNT